MLREMRNARYEGYLVLAVAAFGDNVTYFEDQTAEVDDRFAMFT
jgi:hypothetical protein